MFPAQTSLIPAAVSLARFMEANGSSGLYPYWYLGTTPFKYLTGPVVPYLLIGLRTIFPGFSFFDLAFFLIFISFFVQAAGWGIFVYSLSGKKWIGWGVGVLTLILPWHVFSALGLGETSAVLASALTPWVLLAFVWGPVSSSSHPTSSSIQNRLRALDGTPSVAATPRKTMSIARLVSRAKRVKGQLSIVLTAVAFAVLLLTNTTASVPAIVGILILAVLGNKNWQEAIKRVGIVMFTGWFLTLWWYSPGYWLTIWGAPGIGGKNIFGVLSTLADFLRGFLPVMAALLFVFWKVKPRTVFEKFSLGWMVLFGSLTMFRFMADWDFWMDWTAWMGEVEVGMALLIAGPLTQLISGPVARSSHPTSSASSKSLVNQHSIPGLRALDGTPSARNTRKLSVLVVMFSIYLLGGWGLAIINRDFWMPRAKINNTVEYKIADWFSNNLTIQQFNNSTIFLSGTTAFWLNSLADVKQVRGGRDEGSVDSRWREVAWEVREGVDGSRSASALKSLGVDFLVVHTDRSSEYYHDFKNPEKFEDSEYFEQKYSDHGDIIYRIK